MGSCEHDSKSSAPIRGGKDEFLGSQATASQEGFCSMQLVEEIAKQTTV